VGPLDDSIFRALIEQGWRICPRHPDLLPSCLAAIREKGKGVRSEELQAIQDEMEESAF
jgi:hypothetical protein